MVFKYTAQKFWKIMGFQKMTNSHDVQLVNSGLRQEKGETYSTAKATWNDAVTGR